MDVASTSASTSELVIAELQQPATQQPPSKQKKKLPKKTHIQQDDEDPPRPKLTNNIDRLSYIQELAQKIILAIDDAKSVTSENKRNTKIWANEIETLARETMLSVVHGSLMVEVKASIESTIKTEMSKLSITAPSEVAPPTYAQIASSKVTSPPKDTKPKTKPSIIVFPSSDDKSRKQVSEQWRNSINFKTVSYAPAGIQPVGKNRLRVEFDTVDQRDETLKRLESSTEIRAEPSRKLKPMIILKGVTKQTPTDELTKLIIQQNPEIGLMRPSTEDLQYRFERRNKNDKLYNAVILTSPPIWRKIIELGRLNVDHQKVHAEEFVPLLQCYKCSQFGHLKKHCTREETLCTHCGIESHTFETCPSKNNKEDASCGNCSNRDKRLNTTSNTKHSATSNKCPVKEAMRNRVMGRIDYGA